MANAQKMIATWSNRVGCFNGGFGSCVWATHTYYKRFNLAL